MGRNGEKARHRKIEFDLVFTYPKKGGPRDAKEKPMATQLRRLTIRKLRVIKKLHTT